MRKQQKHVQGRRGEAFAKLIRGVPRKQILCVAIDVHKYYHKVLIVNACLEILVPSFEVDIFQSGYELLCAVIDAVVAKTEAQGLFIGMEPTGHYFENLARRLLERYPHIRLVNSYAVKQNRNQKMLRRQKDDQIDLCAIADLLLRNECFPFQPLREEHLRLQYWVRYRKAKVKMRTALKNQIIGHLDRIFPGLVWLSNKVQDDGHPRLFARFWENQTAQRLIRLCPNPRQLAAMQPELLRELYHVHGYRLGIKTAQRIIHFAQQVLLPSEDEIEARMPLLQTDLQLLDSLNGVISSTEQQISTHLAKTKGLILAEVKGIGILRAASYVAGIGNPDHYEHAGQTFRRSGLVSGRDDSGIRQRGGQGQHVTKVGDSHLRSALHQVTMGLCQWQPYFDEYKNRLEARGKHPGVAAVATARKANGVLFALMRDQSHFEPRNAKGQLIPPRGSVRGKKKAAADIGPSKAALS